MYQGVARVVDDVDRGGGGKTVANLVLREAERAPAGALATALFNQPMRPRNGSRAGAVGVGR